MMGISAFVFKDAVYSTTVTVPGLIKSLLFIPYKMESRNGPVLEVGWTLQFEMFFYGVTGICIILAGNKKRAALICGITVSAFYIILQIINSKVWLLNYYQKGLFPEFIYGLLLYRLYTRVPEKPKTPVKFIILHIMIGLFSLMYLIYSDIGGFRISNNRNIYYGIPSLLLAGSIVLLEKSIKNNRFINFCVALGEASYAMYLFHPFIILFLSRILFPKIIGENGSFIINLIKIITALGAAIGGSMLIYKIIDKPIQSCARSRLLNRIETRSNTN
jgi:peptidoglycan/LPS O-acetylase OafA/YrhL